MTENTFQTSIKYGSIALGISAVLNVYFVMHNFEVFRHTTRAQAVVQQMGVQDQILRGAVQEFATRADSDARIAEIFRRAQSMNFSNSPLNGLNPQ